MRNVFATTALALGSIAPLAGNPLRPRSSRFPAGFHIRRIATNGTTLYTRIGGTGPAVLLHGYGDRLYVVAAGYMHDPARCMPASSSSRP